MSTNNIQSQIEAAEARRRDAQIKENERLRKEHAHQSEIAEADRQIANLRREKQRQELEADIRTSQTLAEENLRAVEHLAQVVAAHKIDEVKAAFEDGKRTFDALIAHNTNGRSFAGDYPFFRLFSWGVHPNHAALATLKDVSGEELRIRQGVLFPVFGEAFTVRESYDAATATEREQHTIQVRGGW